MKYLRRFCLQSQEGIAPPKRITGGGFGAWLMLVAHCLFPRNRVSTLRASYGNSNGLVLDRGTPTRPRHVSLVKRPSASIAQARAMYGPPLWVTVYFVENCRVKVPFAYVFFYSSTAQTRSKLRRGSLAVSQGRRIRFLFFFDAGTEIFVEDHVHFIFSNGFSLVSKGRRIRFLSFLSTRAQKFLSKIGK